MSDSRRPSWARTPYLPLEVTADPLLRIGALARIAQVHFAAALG